MGWKFSYKTQIQKQININGCHSENLRVEGSNMAVSKGGFYWCLLLDKAERHLNRKKNCQLFRDNLLPNTLILTHTHTIVTAEEMKKDYPTCSTIVSSQ